MYPADYFSLFPPFPREEQVFVAMSFDERFEQRWKQVIAPGVKRVHVNGKSLKPYRVDTRQVSDSILTEILRSIAHSWLIFADLTTVGKRKGTPLRNGNVMYEVGIAHAKRLCEEVILFRSDKDPLPFDVTNIRVNYYNPASDPEKACQQVHDALNAAVQEIELRKHLAVQRAISQLDYPGWQLLIEADIGDGVKPPPKGNWYEAWKNSVQMNTIPRLLELGLLSTEYPETASKNATKLQLPLPEEELRYKVTPFGNAVLAQAEAMNLLSPEIRQNLRQSSLIGRKPPTTRKRCRDRGM